MLPGLSGQHHASIRSCSKIIKEAIEPMTSKE